MNKDVIYIEPEDDITNIIAKLESAKEKIVALVPPKKSGVLRSVVNIKLITKASTAKNKQVVFVTTDPSIIKLAATAKIPVTKNLQTAPTIPSLDDDSTEVASEEVLEEEPKEDTEKDEPAEEEEKEAEETEEAEDDDKDKSAEEEKSDEKEAEDDKKDLEKDLAATTEAVKKEDEKKEKKKKEKKEKKKSDNPVIAWISAYRKWVILGAAALALLILFLIWALVIAPAVKITVQVRTDLNNFSELVSFTSDPEKENSDEGVFYLEEIKVEEEQKTEFTATGTKNIGEKASGEIIIQTFFLKNETNKPLNINAGSAFKAGGITFYSQADASLSWGGDVKECENFGTISIMDGCLRSSRVAVVAAAPGEVYNVDKTSFVAPSSRITAYSEAAFTGGTDKNVTIVSSENVASAKAKIANDNNTEEKKQAIEKALNEQIGEDKVKITSSYKQVMSDPESSPKVDEEVTENVIPSITVKTTTSIYVLDKTKLEEFISKKAKLAEDQKIYAINDPFVESFMSTEAGYTGKLKTAYFTGPKITENDIMELVKGKGFGDIRHDLGSVNGVSKISIDESYPWVNSAPNDSNKITIEIVLEEEEKNNP